MKAFILILIVFLLGNVSFAQFKNLGADDYIQARRYPEALVELNLNIESTKLDSDRQVLYLKQAFCYFEMHNYKQANVIFENQSQDIASWETLYKTTYFQSLRNEGDYEKAQNIAQNISYSSDQIKDLVAYPMIRINKSEKFKIGKTNLDAGASFLGIFCAESSAAISVPFKSDDSETIGYDLCLVKVNQDSIFDLNNKKDLLPKKSTVLFRGNPGQIDKNKWLFTESVSDREVYKEKRIHKTQLADSGENVLNLRVFDTKTNEFDNLVAINADNSNSVTPFYSEEHHTIFFSSDRSGGKGGYDVYYSMGNDETWTTPKLLKGCNTMFDDVYPTIVGDKIFFSSRGGENYGGLDIFQGTLNKVAEEFEIINVTNLGKPINSSYDDFSMCWNGKDKGYFASNRNGDDGVDQLYYFNYQMSDSLQIIVWDESKFKIDAHVDIFKKDEHGEWKFVEKVNISKNGTFSYLTDPDEKYRFDIKADSYQDRVLYVPSEEAEELRVDAKSGLRQVVMKELEIKGEVIDIITEKTLAGVTISIYEVKDGNKELIETILVDENGKWKFPFNRNKDYEVELNLKDYEKAIFEIPSDKTRDRSDFVLNLQNATLSPSAKEGDVLTIDNIYFEFDSDEITAESLPILDNIIALLVKKPELVIELSAHTDCVGPDSYNLKLSQKRAKSCFEYLVAKEIDADRLKPVGYGEQFIKNGCVKSGQCSEEENKINRRIEVKFI